MWRLVAKSREVSKSRDMNLERSPHFVFGRRLGSSAAEAPAKLQSFTTMLISEILRYHYRLMNISIVSKVKCFSINTYLVYRLISCQEKNTAAAAVAATEIAREAVAETVAATAEAVQWTQKFLTGWAKLISHAVYSNFVWAFKGTIYHNGQFIIMDNKPYSSRFY